MSFVIIPDQHVSVSKFHKIFVMASKWKTTIIDHLSIHLIDQLAEIVACFVPDECNNITNADLSSDLKGWTVFAKNEGRHVTYIKGRLLRQTNYVDGIRNGLQLTFWHEIGSVSERSNYKNNVKHGTAEHFGMDGSLEYVELWNNGEIGKRVRKFHSS